MLIDSEGSLTLVKFDGDLLGTQVLTRDLIGSAHFNDDAPDQAQVTSSSQDSSTSYAYAYGYLDQSVTTALADLRKLCSGREILARQSVADRIHQIEMQLADRQSEATRQLASKLSERDASEIVAEFAARATISP